MPRHQKRASGGQHGITTRARASFCLPSLQVLPWMPSQDFCNKAIQSSIRFRCGKAAATRYETLVNLSQVIFARMGITFILSSVYMWYTQVPDLPLGAPSVRGWLVLRAVFGFGGLYCLYCEYVNRRTNTPAHDRQTRFTIFHWQKQRSSAF